MTEIFNDPIISLYCQLISRTQSLNSLPEYSEIYLRLAFKSIFNLDYKIDADILQLYRKLLVIYYCQQYPYISDVYTIMEKCFNKNDLYVIIAEREQIICRWKEFKKNGAK